MRRQGGLQSGVLPVKRPLQGQFGMDADGFGLPGRHGHMVYLCLGRQGPRLQIVIAAGLHAAAAIFKRGTAQEGHAVHQGAVHAHVAYRQVPVGQGRRIGMQGAAQMIQVAVIHIAVEVDHLPVEGEGQVLRTHGVVRARHRAADTELPVPAAVRTDTTHTAQRDRTLQECVLSVIMPESIESDHFAAGFPDLAVMRRQGGKRLQTDAVRHEMDFAHPFRRQAARQVHRGHGRVRDGEIQVEDRVMAAVHLAVHAEFPTALRQGHDDRTVLDGRSAIERRRVRLGRLHQVPDIPFFLCILRHIKDRLPDGDG